MGHFHPHYRGVDGVAYDDASVLENREVFTFRMYVSCYGDVSKVGLKLVTLQSGY